MKSFKEQFPIFQKHNNLIYLDNAATTQKPQVVIDAISNFYATSNANVHRGLYKLAEDASQIYENSRKSVAKFINAKSNEIIFTSGATQSIQILIQSLLMQNNIKKILVSPFEHNSALLPLSRFLNAQIDLLELNDNFEIDYGKIKNQYDLVIIPHISNVTGTFIDTKKIRQKVGENCIIILDATQSVAHMKLDVSDLAVNAIAFSGHKMYAPQGIGVLYIQYDLLNKLEPFFGGGGTINSVELNNGNLDIEYKNGVEKFEAGTPNVAGAFGLSTAIEWIEEIGFEKIQNIEGELRKYFLEKITKIKDITLYHSLSENSGSVISFTHNKIHPHDIAQFLGDNNICVRAGHHCAHIFHKQLDIKASVRVSFGIYNTKEEIDIFSDLLEKAIEYYI